MMSLMNLLKILANDDTVSESWEKENVNYDVRSERYEDESLTDAVTCGSCEIKCL